jgi:F-type H+-transporting ATPase subunit delta
MAEVATIARPYAEAVFALADKAGKLGEWSAALKMLAATAADGTVKGLLSNPNVTSAQLTDLFLATGAGEIGPEVKTFVQTLAENHRLAALDQIQSQFETLKNERESSVEAQIVSAFPMAPDQISALVVDLERRFKRRIQPVVTVDQALIGGVKVAIGDEVVDGSVRGKLAAMAVALKT